MSKILGLDLGTNSIGWAVVERNGSEYELFEYKDLPTKGVSIFQEGVNSEKGIEKSRASERTQFRSARKLNFRRKLRKYETLKVLINYGMCPLSIESLELWKLSKDKNSGKKQSFKKYPTEEQFISWLRTDEKTNKNPYYLRYLLSKEKVSWENDISQAYNLGRVFYHLAQRRGFKSNRLEQTDDSKIATLNEQLSEIVIESASRKDLHDKFNNLLNEYDFIDSKNVDLDETEIKIKKILTYIKNVISDNIKSKDYKVYSDVTEEIKRYINRKENLGTVKGAIRNLSDNIVARGCETLGQYFWELYQKERSLSENKIRNNYTGREEHYEHEFEVICDKQHIPEELKTKLKKAIFYQRPLRSQKGSVGKCSFEKDKPRCPISKPEFEEFRMLSFINNIKIKSPEDEKLRKLNQVEREKVTQKFYRQKKTFKFSDLTSAINPNAAFMFVKDRDQSSSDWLVNYPLNTTVSGCPVSAGLKNIFGDDWQGKVFNYSLKQKDGATITKSVNYVDIWHVLFTFEDKEKLIDFSLNKLKLDERNANKLSRIIPEQGYAQISLKAINKIVPWLRKGLIYSHAVFMANIDEIVKKDIWADETKRNLIQSHIEEIIEDHGNQIIQLNAVNELIKTFKSDYVYSDIENVEFLTEKLREKLKKSFGYHTWSKLHNKDEIIKSTLDILIEQVRKIHTKNAFAKVKTIDEKIKEFLLDHELVRSKTDLDKLYHPSALDDFKAKEVVIDGVKKKILPSPKTNSIKNPVLMRTMHQMRKLINELLISGIIDENTRIHLEMAREINDANKRAAWKNWQDSLRDKKEEAVKKIKELYEEKEGKEINPTEDDILRYLLWLEQDKREIYEYVSNNICISDIVGPDPKYDIEHTLPRSKSWDNSMMNKTLCSKHFNRTVKKNQIPAELSNHDEILRRVDGWKKKYLQLDKEIKKINTAGIVDKNIKDKLIVKRHILKFEYDYWKGKYDRFVMKDIPEGFKNSQIVDTGLITKFARQYLSSIFKTQNGNSNVMVVNGLAVSEFRKIWGIQNSYEKKSRSNHIHHCIDAITIACITKKMYDNFAENWRLQEEMHQKHDVKYKLNFRKPWETFTEDMLNIDKSTIIVHDSTNNVPKQSKKKLRNRGKIVNKKGTKEPIYLQGDTARGSLNQTTFYGAIKSQKSGEIEYVVRKSLDMLGDKDIEKIVDDRVRSIVQLGRKEESTIKKEIEKLKKRKQTAEEEEEKIILEQIEKLDYKIANEIYVIPPKDGKATFTPIRKVRIKARLTEPLPNFKKHRDKKVNAVGKEKFPYKTWYYVQNDQNYCLAIYEDLEKDKRAAQIVNMMDAAQYFKSSNKAHSKEFPIVDTNYKGLPLKGLLRTNLLVLFYENTPEEIWKLSQQELVNRLYYVKKTGKDGRATFQHHQEARNDKQLEGDYLEEHKVNPPKSIKNGFSSVDFKKLPVPRLLLSPSNFKFLIEGKDFEILKTGLITKL